MKTRTLGKTGFSVTEVSLGTWQVGGKWGEPFSDPVAESILNKALDEGTTFLDTADVYGDGKSEAACARVVKARSAKVRIATKCGRRLQPHTDEAYTPRALQGFVEDSLRNTGLESLDLVQLHCPPTAVFYRPEIFELFDRLKSQGKILNLGVSVEKVEEGLKALEYPNVTTVQIIFNMFRQRPAELFFKEAARRNVGILARVPLASGLLTGTMTASSSFGPQDHRTFNRQGEAFDKGETFSGVPFDLGLAAVEELKRLFRIEAGGPSLAQWALRWVLMFPEVSCVIPGASRPEQVASNIAAAALPPLSGQQMDGVKAVYDRLIRPHVHQIW